MAWRFRKHRPFIQHRTFISQSRSDGSPSSFFSKTERVGLLIGRPSATSSSLVFPWVLPRPRKWVQSSQRLGAKNIYTCRALRWRTRSPRTPLYMGRVPAPTHIPHFLSAHQQCYQIGKYCGCRGPTKSVGRTGGYGSFPHANGGWGADEHRQNTARFICSVPKGHRCIAARERPGSRHRG